MGQFRNKYSSMSDSELYELANKQHELRDDAIADLHEEMQYRGLEIPSPPDSLEGIMEAIIREVNSGQDVDCMIRMCTQWGMSKEAASDLVHNTKKQFNRHIRKNGVTLILSGVGLCILGIIITILLSILTWWIGFAVISTGLILGGLAVIGRGIYSIVSGRYIESESEEDQWEEALNWKD